ncbi:nucleotide exchange factor GrpE [Patescibacteria group bacterium]|nr:nucleotide exchange factor GrpE [Patescibacteria group bacterium]
MNQEKEKDQEILGAVEDNEANDVNESETDCLKCAEYLEGWRRAKADYANLEKQTDKARLDYIAFANENLLQEILPAIDQYETALEFIPDISKVAEPEKTQILNWITGIKAVKQLWEQMFEDIGLKRIPESEKFDPTLHNAVGKEVDKTKPVDSIVKIVQPGWMLKNKVLRPSRVIVNSHDEDQEDNP